MDAVIRSALVAPFRTRLSASQPGPVDTAQLANEQTSRPPQKTLRAEVEEQVRAELASQAQKVYEEERQRAHANGYADGIAEAQAAAAEHLAQARAEFKARMQSALAAIEQAQQARLEKLASSVGEIAFAAVCRLAGHKAASPAFVLGIVEQTCAQLRGDATGTARLHPRDIEALSEFVPGAELRIQGLGLRVIPDESLELGGCVIEASSGRYDGGLETQLRRLHAVLAEVATPESSALIHSTRSGQVTQ